MELLNGKNVDKKMEELFKDSVFQNDKGLEQLRNMMRVLLSHKGDEDLDLVEIYKPFKKRCKEFLNYFEGYVRHARNPIKRLISFFSDLEKILFGDIKTKSWS